MTQPDEQSVEEQRERALDRLTMDYPITFDVPPDAEADEPPTS